MCVWESCFHTSVALFTEKKGPIYLREGGKCDNAVGTGSGVGRGRNNAYKTATKHAIPMVALMAHVSADVHHRFVGFDRKAHCACLEGIWMHTTFFQTIVCGECFVRRSQCHHILIGNTWCRRWKKVCVEREKEEEKARQKNVDLLALRRRRRRPVSDSVMFSEGKVHRKWGREGGKREWHLLPDGQIWTEGRLHDWHPMTSIRLSDCPKRSLHMTNRSRSRSTHVAVLSFYTNVQLRRFRCLRGRRRWRRRSRRRQRLGNKLC